MQARQRILVADDDRDIRELIRTRLNASGYDAHVARDGAEAMTQIAVLEPAGIVLDINMPILDGFGVLQAIKARGWRFPVLVLTARHAAEDVRRAVSLGAKDYLSKPFTEAQLQARVARLVRAPMAAPDPRTLV